MTGVGVNILQQSTHFLYRIMTGDGYSMGVKYFLTPAGAGNDNTTVFVLGDFFIFFRLCLLLFFFCFTFVGLLFCFCLFSLRASSRARVCL